MQKRLFDLTLALFLLLVLSPFFLVIAMAICIIDGMPIFFVQERPGFKGRLFKIIKFRTMKSAKLNDLNLKDDCERTTTLGKFLRNSSLDELPEILNVIKGDMSFVGPRPLLKEYIEHFSASQMRRHDCLPGITGWAQVNGRNKLSWEQKFDLDLWYLENQSFALDIRIIFKTFGVVILNKDVSPDDGKSVVKFTGSR